MPLQKRTRKILFQSYDVHINDDGKIARTNHNLAILPFFYVYWMYLKRYPEEMYDLVSEAGQKILNGIGLLLLSICAIAFFWLLPFLKALDRRQHAKKQLKHASE
jgi:hypothetical protein